MKMFMLVRDDKKCGWAFRDAYKAIKKEQELLERGIRFHVYIF